MSDSKPLVLCVDDEPMVLSALRRALRRESFEIMVVEGGAQAIAALDDHQFHCIICDQRMPGIDGPAVLTHALKTQPDAFRITLTGYTDMQAAQRSINDGQVDLFLTKPWEDDQLRQIVRDGVERSRMAIENRSLQEEVQRQNEKLRELSGALEQRVRDRTAEVAKRNGQVVALLKQGELTLNDAVGVTTDVLALLDPASAARGRRVGDLARKVAAWSKLPESDQRDAYFAGRLHEIGRVADLARSIHGVKGGGDNEEKATPWREVGYGLLARVRGFRQVARAIRYQDEHWDGQGSPYKTRGPQIPALARVLAVVKAYDDAVFASRRADRPDPSAGRAALEAQRGSALDPTIANCLLKHLATQPTDTERAESEISIFDLRPGVQLADEIRDFEGRLLVSVDGSIDHEMLNRLRDLARAGRMDSLVWIRHKKAKTSAARDEQQVEDVGAKPCDDPNVGKAA